MLIKLRQFIEKQIRVLSIKLSQCQGSIEQGPEDYPGGMYLGLHILHHPIIACIQVTFLMIIFVVLLPVILLFYSILLIKDMCCSAGTTCYGGVNSYFVDVEACNEVKMCSENIFVKNQNSVVQSGNSELSCSQVYVSIEGMGNILC
ncbi:hypothetical protein EDL79_04135 [Ehrlichia ruminantium]|uniref:Uncharacterized protein n=1 Tax=Ehrlichia ruminantium TaxID=779 RepID=A0AAE6QBV5_EHRRU|nr:hypothetical protein [Ehrlichia ruminantium]QGR02802.1 hypothetical protein EDL81_04115 [Ehrlichia ruminantium]QGR03726.1 hypothetical protein EDL80_04125 [Ehrlichia ruminantium]QGR04653.1 hypothetical protein EDL79_04135 [Ehrlichia ruminantium]